MSCSRRETTIAWCHGEADDAESLAHVAGCADCRETVAEVEAVWSAVAGRVAPPPVRVDRRSWGWVVAIAAPVALAAGFALWPAPSPGPGRATEAMDPLDAELVDLELALDDLDFELDSL